MAASEQEAKEPVGDEQAAVLEQEIGAEVPDGYVAPEEAREPEQRFDKARLRFGVPGERSGFIHGLSVGAGIGCIATFVIMWIAIYFTPQLPQNVTYESMLAVFIYPLIYLLAVGLVALTAGIVREYYVARR